MGCFRNPPAVFFSYQNTFFFLRMITTTTPTTPKIPRMMPIIAPALMLFSMVKLYSAVLPISSITVTLYSPGSVISSPRVYSTGSPSSVTLTVASSERLPMITASLVEPPFSTPSKVMEGAVPSTVTLKR